MYKYEYEKITTQVSGFGITEYKTIKHQKIIDQRASDGWRYVGYIPTLQRGNGYIEEMELVFEKYIEE